MMGDEEEQVVCSLQRTPACKKRQGMLKLNDAIPVPHTQTGYCCEKCVAYLLKHPEMRPIRRALEVSV